jgi:hypothetical protein
VELVPAGLVDGRHAVVMKRHLTRGVGTEVANRAIRHNATFNSGCPLSSIALLPQ